MGLQNAVYEYLTKITQLEVSSISILNSREEETDFELLTASILSSWERFDINSLKSKNEEPLNQYIY